MNYTELLSFLNEDHSKHITKMLLVYKEN